jgi:hypothetical protein
VEITRSITSKKISKRCPRAVKCPENRDSLTWTEGLLVTFFFFFLYLSEEIRRMTVWTMRSADHKKS